MSRVPESQYEVDKKFHFEQGWRLGASAMREKAAKVAEFHSGPSIQLADKIRALPIKGREPSSEAKVRIEGVVKLVLEGEGKNG